MVSEPDIDKLLVDKFNNYKAPLPTSSNINKYILTEKGKKTPSISERVTLDQKLKQFSKYEKKVSNPKEELGEYNPINTEINQFMNKKKIGNLIKLTL